MISYVRSKNKINPKNILGGMLGSFEDGFESESFVSSVKGTAEGFFEAIVDLGKTAAGTESKSETNEKEKFDMNGSIDFKKQEEKQKKEQAKIKRQTLFFQNLKQDQEKARREEEQTMEQEIAELVASIPMEQRNELLGLQTEYRNSNSIYHRSELRRKIIEQRNKTKQQQKEASIPSPAKKASALEGAFEGGSGTQGGGQANLSNQAVG